MSRAYTAWRRSATHTGASARGCSRTRSTCASWDHRPMATRVDPRTAPASGWEQYEALFSDIDAPFALVDLDALWSNAAEMTARGRSKPIRVASKSVRCRRLLEEILERPG